MSGGRNTLGHDLVKGWGWLDPFANFFGAIMGVGIAGGAIGPWITGLAYDMSGSYAPGFALALGCCVASAISIWLAAR